MITRRPITRRWAMRLAGLLVVMLGVAAWPQRRVAAHPLATTTVAIAVRSDDVHVIIAADADPLIAKLEALGDLAPSAIRTGDERTARLRDLTATLLSHLDLRTDGSPLALESQRVSVDDTGQATWQLRASLPPRAQSLTWRSTFIFGSYPLAVRQMSGRESVEWLQGPETSAPVAIHNGGSSLSFPRGLVMGFTHIVPAGLDHILFVVGLYLLSRRTREVLLQVTAFTVAHSITLGLGLYGFVSVPPAIVEPLIALSVAYVGVENLFTSRLHPWRVAFVFLFGLLHGMGFADALSGLRLSAASLASTLVSFNIGVEAGQLAVIAMAAAVLVALTHVRASAARPAARIASAAIGLAGLLWTIERVI